MGAHGMPLALRATCLATLAGLLAGCELEDITLVQAEDVVIAEVYVQLDGGGGGDTTIRAFLHRTLGLEGSRPVPGAAVTITRQSGATLELAEAGQALCIESLPIEDDGTCYWASPEPGRVDPGETLRLDVVLPDGGVLTSATTVPGSFEPVGIPSGGPCRIAPDTTVELRWSRSGGAWAYVNETLLRGIGPPLAAEGIEAEDPLYLLGLSVSAADTTIVFPSEFGLFNRFELEQDLALRLQRGLPDGVVADVTVTATDRNYVNWVRGGNFNPSGQVRLPSVRGDGTGVFAAVVVQRLQIVSSADPQAAPACPS